MAEKIDYNKLINELFNDDNSAMSAFKPYIDVMKTFMGTPALAEIFENAIKQNSVGTMDIRKFYRKVRTLLIEMSVHHCWRPEDTHIPNENIWNENEPMKCLPVNNHAFFDGEIGDNDYMKVMDICKRIGTDLKKLAAEDFELLNKLHKEYKKG